MLIKYTDNLDALKKSHFKPNIFILVVYFYKLKSPDYDLKISIISMRISSDNKF